MSTKERIIQYAVEMIQTRGHHGFSFDMIAKKVGIRKASMFHHFPSKEDLIVAALKTYRKGLFEQLREKTAHIAKPIKKLEVFFEAHRKIYITRQKLCLCMMLASEYETISDKVKHSTKQFLLEIRAWLIGILVEGNSCGDFAIEDVEAIGDLILSALQGLLLRGRIFVDSMLFDRTVACMKKMINK